MSEKNKKKNMLVFLLSSLFIIFGASCIFLAIVGKKNILFISAIAFLLITVTMNIAERFSVNKHNVKVINILSVILNIIAIPLIFTYNVFSLTFSIPAFILSKKATRLGKDKFALIMYIVSTALIVISIGYSITSLI